MPDSSNFPNKMMSLVHLNNHTRLVDRVSGQDSDFLVGTVVLRLMMTRRAVMTTPAVPIPREGGEKSREKESSQRSDQKRWSYWRFSETSLTIRGIWVEPPTKTLAISRTFDLLILESRMTFSMTFSLGQEYYGRNSERALRNGHKWEKCRSRFPERENQFRCLCSVRGGALSTLASSAETMCGEDELHGGLRKWGAWDQICDQ